MGDEVLRAVGRVLRDNVRTYDTVARYGGDEFVVIAIDADEDAAAEVMAAPSRASARALERLGVDSTATAGVAEWDAGESPTMLIARADASLLEGKHARGKGGRRCAPQEADSESSSARQSRSTLATWRSKASAITPRAPLSSSGLVASAAARAGPRLALQHARRSCRRAASRRAPTAGTPGARPRGGAARSRGGGTASAPTATRRRPRTARPSGRSGGTRTGENGGGRSGLFAPITRCEYSCSGESSSASRDPGTFDARRSSAGGESTWMSASREPAREVAAARRRGDHAGERQPRMGERERGGARVEHDRDVARRVLEEARRPPRGTPRATRAPPPPPSAATSRGARRTWASATPPRARRNVKGSDPLTSGPSRRAARINSGGLREKLAWPCPATRERRSCPRHPARA